MTNLMEKTWSLYEAEKAAGNAETADMIGDVYTALDMLDMGWDAEANWNSLEKAYYNICLLGVQGGLLEIRLGLENELVAAGILEADEEPEETNSATHWDEWSLDKSIDRERDARAVMAYER